MSGTFSCYKVCVNRPVLTLVLLIFSFLTCVTAQRADSLIRYIEVSGYAEFEAEPDEITLGITVEEYLKDDFDQVTHYRNYHRKENLADLERNLLADLKKLGIGSERISIRQMANQWRNTQNGQDDLQSKTYYIVLDNLDACDLIFSKLKSKGISSITVKKLHTRQEESYRRQVMTDALKNAMSKAGILLAGTGYKAGKLISITEISDSRNAPFDESSLNLSGTSFTYSQTANKRTILFKYELRARIEIETTQPSERQF